MQAILKGRDSSGKGSSTCEGWAEDAEHNLGSPRLLADGFGTESLRI